MAEDSVVKRSADQRRPLQGEPICIVCGRYGEYVCDATDDDVCSLECRDLCQVKHQQQTQQSLQLQEQQAERADILRRKLGIQVVLKTASGAGSVVRETQLLPIPMVDFAQEQGTAKLPQELLMNLTANNFERPTPVQMQTIPCVLQGHNVLVSAPTGTGKTASYLVPAIAQVLLKREAEDGEEILALVLAPIRELAIQIEAVAKLLMRGIRDMKTALVVGGFPVPTQRYRLQSGVQLIVATPGRFLDIFTNYSGGESILLGVDTCIVDEVDVMLDVGFRPQISQILSLLATLRNERSVQILFVSATVSDEVEGLVRQVMKGQNKSTYTRVDVCSNSSKSPSTTGMPNFSLNPNVQHQVQWVEDKMKKNALFDFLEGKHEESTLVFVSSKLGATMLAEAIHKRCGIDSASIHADKSQKERLALLEAFIHLEIPVLVSTNVLSRGMDLLHVQNVVIYDIPKRVADYVHLVGRTGRGDDGSGNALTLVNHGDSSIFREFISMFRSSKVRVPREMYQSVHSEDAKQQARSINVVIDESKRAFRTRKQLIDDIGAPATEWKEWINHKSKRQRIGTSSYLVVHSASKIVGDHQTFSAAE